MQKISRALPFYLSIAAQLGDIKIVTMILEKRDANGHMVVDINSVNANGSTALNLAAR